MSARRIRSTRQTIDEEIVCDEHGRLYPDAQHDAIATARRHVRSTGHTVVVARTVIREYTADVPK